MSELCRERPSKNCDESDLRVHVPSYPSDPRLPTTKQTLSAEADAMVLYSVTCVATEYVQEMKWRWTGGKW
jgi:hypothetical protein